MRNYKNLDGYLTKLSSDIYPQPPDAGHTKWADESIRAFLPHMEGVGSVLDVGCGEGFCQSMFDVEGISYQGIALGEDVTKAKAKGLNVAEMDFSFLTYPDKSFDLLYSRHSLEHSPMPLLTLMEWHRVSKRYVALVLPTPWFWGYGGKNHYFMLSNPQWENLFDNAGFNMVYKEEKFYPVDDAVSGVESLIELWFVLEKK